MPGKGRVDDSERRHEDDEQECLERSQPERGARFELALGDRVDPRTNDLGRVGAEIDDHSEKRRAIRSQENADRGEPKKQKKELQQKRRVADDLHIDLEEPSQPFRTAGLCPRTQNSDCSSEKDRLQRKRDRQPRSAQELGPRILEPYETQRLLIHSDTSDAIRTWPLPIRGRTTRRQRQSAKVPRQLEA